MTTNSKPALPLDIAQFDGHTPGPWREVINCADYDAFPALIYSGSMFVAEVATDNSEPNARLIAAVPELLSECKLRRTELVEAHIQIASQREEIKGLRGALENLLKVEEEYGDDTNAAVNQAWLAASDTLKKWEPYTK